jgi:hypothetical protein
MTAKEIVFNIKNLKAGGTQSQDNSLSDFQILSMIDYCRSILIRQQQGNGYRINDNLVQDLGNIDIIMTDQRKRYYITNREIPKPIETSMAVMLTYVGDGSETSYQKAVRHSNKWSKFSRFTSGDPKWYFVGDNIGVSNPTGLRCLQVRGVFESPYKAVVFAGKDDPMDPLNFEYPISSTMIDSIYKMIVDSEFRLQMIMNRDTLNNGSDENQARGN